MIQITHLTPENLPELVRFWNESFPLHPLTPPLLEERVFLPPDAREENLLACRDAGGALIGISLLVPPFLPNRKTGEMIGGIRWFGVHPNSRRQGLGSALLEESCRRLVAAKSARIDFLSTPPFYILPGVDLRQTDVITWLLRRGFTHEATHFNMSLDLAAYEVPTSDRIFPEDAAGYSVRRAREEDRSAFSDLCVREWTTEWRDEAAQGLRHNPGSLFLAVRRGAGGEKEEVVGFAAYETNQCMGTFGPTGVSPAHQGHGLGRRLLWATLADMKSLGRTRVEIGWVGPVDFYHRACGATLGPVFWAMRRKVG